MLGCTIGLLIAVLLSWPLLSAAVAGFVEDLKTERPAHETR